MVHVTYTSSDGCRERRSYKTIEGARRFAQKWVGRRPGVCPAFGYAVSGDGIGKVSWSGCTAADLFPDFVIEGDEQGPDFEDHIVPWDYDWPDDEKRRRLEAYYNEPRDEIPF